MEVFQGFPAPTSNTLYTPNQFFDVVLPYSSRGAVRLVAYLLRKTLGWCDSEGNPVDAEVYASWKELEKQAGIGHSAIKAAIEEAIQKRFIECLHVGAPHSPGQTGHTALYRIRWDDRDEYTTDPARFDGFYSGNANLTYIPNAFFDHLIPREKLSVIRVVGAIVRNTIGWELKRGHRRQRVSMSLTELERRTKQHRETVSVGIKEALAAGYIKRDSDGVFSSDMSEQRAATYSIRWEGEDREKGSTLNLSDDEKRVPLRKSDQVLLKNHSENPTRPSLQNSDQQLSENPTSKTPKSRPEEDSENPTSIEITLRNNTSKQHQSEEPDVVVEGDSLRASVLSDLIDSERAGFSRAAAFRLLERYPAERIRRVLDTISTEGASSKPAFITAAIKDGNYKPAPPPASVDKSQQLFAAGFYRGRAKSGSTVVEPSKSDLGAAKGLVKSLETKKVSGSPELWGETFGQFVKGREVSGKRIATLSLAVKAHADDWLQEFAAEDDRARADQSRRARLSHEEASKEAYRAYLASEEARMRESGYEAFLALEKDSAEQVERIRNSKIRSETAKELALKNMRSDTWRLERFAEFMVERKLVLNFWEWDRRMNPQGYMEVER